jgi:hypothetical protein
MGYPCMLEAWLQIPSGLVLHRFLRLQKGVFWVIDIVNLVA